MISGWASDDDDELITQINVALLADVGLVVLLLLMVASSPLSEVATTCTSHVDDSPAESWPQVLNLEIDAGSQLFIDGVPVDDATLAARARDLVASDGERASAAITAHTRTEHGAVVRLMSILYGEQLNRFSIHVDPDTLPALPAP